jgi:hypothetical protein
LHICGAAVKCAWPQELRTKQLEGFPMTGASPKIVEAVVACFTLVQDSVAPHTLSSIYLDKLSRSGEWTPDELAEVARIIRERLPALSQDGDDD